MTTPRIGCAFVLGWNKGQPNNKEGNRPKEWGRTTPHHSVVLIAWDNAALNVIRSKTQKRLETKFWSLFLEAKVGRSGQTLCPVTWASLFIVYTLRMSLAMKQLHTSEYAASSLSLPRDRS